jgi:hypothetical protein
MLLAPTQTGTVSDAPAMPASAQDRFLAGIAGTDVSMLIENVSTRIERYQMPGGAIPISINDGEYGNCFICSPYSTLVTYALEELGAIESRPLRLLLSAMVRIGGVMKPSCPHSARLSRRLSLHMAPASTAPRPISLHAVR